MPTVTLADFRAARDAFADSVVFPDDVVNFYLPIALGAVSAERWGDAYTAGVCLVIAHYATIAAVDAQATEAGGVGGLRAGPIASESGDKVSVSFATTAVTDPNAGDWNATTWGRQYWQLAKLYGAGPLQVGAGPSFGSNYLDAGTYPYFPWV